jgi:hypothetical protein
MPFAGYDDFDDCVRQNQDKENPEGYCSAIEAQTKADAGATMPRVRFQIVPVVDEPFVAGGEPAVIVDVDGTLLSAENEPFADRIQAINAMAAKVFVITGRLEDERDATESALADGGLEAFNLIMRPNAEVDVSDFKQVEAAKLLENYDVIAAYDNDEDALEEYAELGIDAMRPGVLSGEESEMGYKGKKKDPSKASTFAPEDDLPADDEGDDADLTNDPEMESEEADEDVEMGEDFHALLVVEGVWTGDGRYIEEGALEYRELPLPLMAIDRTTEAHMEAVLIGNITRIEREGREIHGYGSFIESESPDVKRLQTLIKRSELRGISVDLDAVEYEVLVPAEEQEPEITEDGEMAYGMADLKMRVTSARIMGATVVPFPAFQEAFIESLAALTASLMSLTQVTGWIGAFQSFEDIDFVAPDGAVEEAERGLAWREEYGRGGTEVGVARARDIANRKNLSPDTVNRMVSYFARHEVDKEGQGWSPDQDGFPSAGRIAWALWGGDPGRVWAEKVQRQMRAREEAGSIVASGHPIEAPVVPPSEWFANPSLQGPTPLTVTDEGRIFGHLAVWGQCHIGHTNRCVEPPASMTNYAHFLTGEILCDDGSRFPVGQITMNGNHAPHSLGAQATSAHYDNTALAAADVTAGEDQFGIWVAGSIRPDLHSNQIRGLMASDVSGDWRRIGGNLELVAVLAVNVPGFPKIRVREMEGLVASLSLPAYEQAEAQEYLEALAASIGRGRDHRKAELFSRVHGERVADLAKRIKGE